MRPINLLLPCTLLLLCTPTFAAQGATVELARCATDAFGNAVCLDKNGVAIPAPKTLREQMEQDAAAKSGDKAGHGEGKKRKRCGIDQFGNKVCF